MRWSMPHGRWSFVVVALGLLLFASRAGAQTAELRGVVTDSSSLVLPGVSVTIKGAETGVERSLVTDVTGSFRAPGLIPGPYRVTSELMGFKTEVTPITLTVGQVAEMKIALEVGTVSETVEVKGTAETIDTTKSDLSAVVTTKQLDALPVLNRGFIGLAQLLPGGGPARTGDARFGIQTAFGGTNVRSMYSTLIDGSNMDHPVYGFSIVNVNQDAVQEFRVLRNQYDAQYSRAGTAVVNVLTRSGTNLFHGSGSYFGRDASLNAKNYFATTKPPFDLTRLSGTFGGPIQQDKIHFFVAGEYMLTHSATLIALNKTNPFASTWNGSYPSGDKEKTLQAKVNFQINENNSAWVRYALDLLKQDYTYELAQNYDNQVNDLAASWNWTMSASRLNTVTFQYLDQWTNRFDKTQAAQVVRPSFTSGRATNLPQAFPRVHIALSDTFFFAPRRHAFKVGVSMGHERLDYLADWYGGGSWTFNTDLPFDANNSATWPKTYIIGSGPSTQR
ncbi:MAG: carboxypeptidase regulatory-like domain-containing protein, partial [Acidobacteria bacterium]|nr:carboxypeptidase regulatory-like domain-containing protein [Acidobacteriota bacterium]